MCGAHFKQPLADQRHLEHPKGPSLSWAPAAAGLLREALVAMALALAVALAVALALALALALPSALALARRILGGANEEVVGIGEGLQDGSELQCNYTVIYPSWSQIFTTAGHHIHP